MSAPACDRCKWWDRLTTHPEDGRCRRYAPRPVSGDNARGRWPVTDAKDWCAEGEAIGATVRQRRRKVSTGKVPATT